MGPALVQITTSVPSLAAEKKKNVVRKERGPLAKQHKNDVGLLFPKYNTFDSCGVKSKNSNSDLHQGCSFQVDYCHAKHVSVTEPRVGFAVIREPDEMYSLFRETVSSNVTERALLTFYVITTSLGHPSPSL